MWDENKMKSKRKWDGLADWSLTRLILDEILDEAAHQRSNLNYLVSIEVCHHLGGIALLEVLGIQNVIIHLIQNMRWII